MSRVGKCEAVVLSGTLVAAFHAVPFWLFRFFDSRELRGRLGENVFWTLFDVTSCILPLALCLAAPRRSGLKLGQYKAHAWKVLGICIVPVVLTALIYPLTSRPFQSQRIGMWLVSPLAQDLLFAGYLFGLLNSTFPGSIHQRLPIRQAVFLTALFLALWHVPNFQGVAAAYVSFQLIYTFLFCGWLLLARQLTGSLLPGLLTHMACNFIAWL
jgi:membrane protease YdiL (CAAX protease family)